MSRIETSFPRPIRAVARRTAWLVALALAAHAPAATAQTLTLPDSLAALVRAALPVSGVLAPRVGGYLQVRELAQRRVGLTAAINRARVSVDGNLPAAFSYRTLVEFEAAAGARSPAAVSLREAIVRWSGPSVAVTAGEFKTPFSREYLIPVPALETADLAVVVDSLAPKYDVGVMGEATWGALGTVALGAFNGEGANATANRDSTVLLVGRLTATPLPQVALGASAARDRGDSLRWGVDFSLAQSGAVVRAEYITRHVRGRARDRDDYGWYVFGSLRVLPWAQLLARQEAYERPWAGAATRIRATTLGTGLELAPERVRLLVEGVRRWTGAPGRAGDGLIAQVQAQF